MTAKNRVGETLDILELEKEVASVETDAVEEEKYNAKLTIVEELERRTNKDEKLYVQGEEEDAEPDYL